MTVPATSSTASKPLNIAYIAFGSNLAAPLTQISDAMQSISALGKLTAVSPLYASKAIGPGSQPDYINGVCLLHTALDAYSLLSSLQSIEAQQGRVRTVKNAARTLDLDILLYNDLVQDDPILIIPHPRMHERNFVIMPLCDISPSLEIPELGTIFNIKEKLSLIGLKKLDITLEFSKLAPLSDD